MRLVLTLVSLLLLGPAMGSAQTQAQTREDIVLTGGPALRFMEHGKAASHDFYWFNSRNCATRRSRMS